MGIIVDHFVQAEKARRQQAKPAAEKALVEALKTQPEPGQTEAQPQPENLQIPPDPRPNHAYPEKSASHAFTDARDQIRKEHVETQMADLKQQVENYNPQIVGIDGRIDHAFVTKLKQVFAKNPDGSTNYLETLRTRELMVTGFEREKERGGKYSANRFNQ